MPPNQTPLDGVRDGLEAVASTFFLLLTMIVAGAAVGVLVWVAMNAPFGTQGEWLYVGGGALAALLWAVGKAVSLIRRRHRVDGGRTSGPSIDWTIGGLAPPAGAGNVTWRVETQPVMSTLTLDHRQLETARALHASGLAWEEIARRVNPGYDRLDPMAQTFYKQAIEMVVLHPPAIVPEPPADRG